VLFRRSILCEEVGTNERNSKPVSPRELLGAIVFYGLMVFLFPLTLVGYVIWVASLLLNGPKSGVSVTAQGPLTARWTQHMLGTRRDVASYRLLLALPGVPRPGMRLVAGPLLMAHRLTGYVPKTFRYPYQGEIPVQAEAAARMTFFDDVVDRYLPGMTQFVILGAGFDTRAYQLPLGTRVQCFEVDQPKTQALKRELLAQAQIDASGVTFVSADFETEDWLARLVAAGFDPVQPALFLWEGVIMYLDRAAARSTLRKIASTARGSVVAFDYFTSEALESQALYFRFARATTTASGEPLRFGVDSTSPSRERLAEFLSSCGLTLDEQRTLGQETAGRRAWGGFATAIVA
jgi:methyltransferase (TIGR00027 family)